MQEGMSLFILKPTTSKRVIKTLIYKSILIFTQTLANSFFESSFCLFKNF